MPANTGADKFAGAQHEKGGKRGIASGRGGSNPFQVREESRRSETIYFLFLSAILLPHSNNARGRGIEEKGERSQANWIRMLRDRKDLKRSCGIPDSRENFMLVCRAAGSALPPRLDPNES